MTERTVPMVQLRDVGGRLVHRFPRVGLVQQGGDTQAVVWRGRVFRLDMPVGEAARQVDLMLREVATVSLDPFGCPTCGIERADYEGEPGRYLPTCPDCGSDAHPVPIGYLHGHGGWRPVQPGEGDSGAGGRAGA